MIDLHCHVLPDIDDGPQTLEDAINLCAAARAEGTDTVVATSHINWEYPDVDAAAIHAGVQALDGELHAAGIELRVRPGAEVALARAGELSDEELGRLTLGGGPNLLLELPWRTTGTGIAAAVAILARRGFGLLLAHPERTPMLRDDPALVRRLVDNGAWCCLNAASLTDTAGRTTRRAARRLLDDGLIHAIASDGHDHVGRRPALGSILRETGMSPEAIDYFTERSPRAILEGAPVEPPPELSGPRGRRRLSRLRR